MSTEEKNPDFKLFKYYKPDVAGGQFIKYYILNYMDDSKKNEFEIVSESISKMGLDRVLQIYSSMEKELSSSVKSENYEKAAEVKKAIEYFKEHILDRTPRP